MKALVHVHNEDSTAWIDGIRRWLPELETVQLQGDDLPPGLDPAEIDIAIAWRMPHGIFARLPNLKLIQSMAAGVDHILSDPHLPAEVPIARLVDPWMGRSMTHHVVGHILRWHRDIDRFMADRATETWPNGITFDPDAATIGILGMGHLGQAVARGLRALDFPVIGWSRSPKAVDDLEVLSGPSGLDTVARRANALVCLLPLTEETRGLINAGLLAKMPGAGLVVNVGRGGHVIEADLLTALDQGTLKAAALDVFHQEPLPKGHPFWSHPRIWPTPHIAAEVNLPTASRAFADTIQRIRANETPNGLIDRAKGY